MASEEAKITSEGVKAPSRHTLLSIYKSLITRGVVGGVLLLSVIYVCFEIVFMYG
ncbi:hypothetical protein Hanom_Chr16g01468661 [Helianthus anomalus]